MLLRDVIDALKVTFKYAPFDVAVPLELQRCTVIAVIFGAVYARDVIVVDLVAVLPRASVTVVLIVNVPLFFNAGAVNDEVE